VHNGTVIDFAYAVHSDVGNKMIGGKVNGKMVPVDHVLNTGDQVEIITATNSKGPSQDWLKKAKSSRAISKINQWFSKAGRVENLQKGRLMLEEAAKERDVTFDLLLENGREKDLLERFSCKNLEQMYNMIHGGGLKERLVINHLYREYEKTLPPPTDEELIQSLLASARPETKKQKSGIVVKGIGDTQVRFGKCCGPLPGDKIVGFVTRGRGLSVHRTDCVNIINLNELDRRRLIEASWEGDGITDKKDKHRKVYNTDLRIICNDRDGLVLDITRVLAHEKISVTSINMRADQGEAICYLTVGIYDGSHLEYVKDKLMNIPSVCEIDRVFT